MHTSKFKVTNQMVKKVADSTMFNPSKKCNLLTSLRFHSSSPKSFRSSSYTDISSSSYASATISSILLPFISTLAFKFLTPIALNKARGPNGDLKPDNNREERVQTHTVGKKNKKMN